MRFTDQSEPHFCVCIHTRSLMKQLSMISELMAKTREQHLSTVSLTHMSFTRFVIMKTYYLLREHLSNFFGK